MTITLLNTPETFESLQPFISLQDHNDNMMEIRKQYNDHLTKSEKRILDHISQYSCKYPGLSYKSKEKVARDLEISKRTVIRACNKFAALGFIKQHAVKRHNGDRRQSSNIIVFIRLKQDVTPECHPKKALPESLVPSYTKDTVNPDEMIKKGLANKMPKRIAHVLSAFFDAEGMYNAYGAMLRGKASIDRTIAFEQHEDEYYKTILSVMELHKRGKVRKDLFGMINKAVANTTKRLHVTSMFNSIFE